MNQKKYITASKGVKLIDQNTRKHQTRYCGIQKEAACGRAGEIIKYCVLSERYGAIRARNLESSDRDLYQVADSSRHEEVGDPLEIVPWILIASAATVFLEIAKVNLLF